MMEEALEKLIKRTEQLTKALKVAQASGNPIIKDTCDELQTAFARAATLIEVRRGILQRKKDIVAEMEAMTVTANILADRAEEFNQNLFPENSFENYEQGDQNKENSNCYEVSPIPSSWANGALNTPGMSNALRQQNNMTVLHQEKHVFQIKPLQVKELNSVPGYMKGRITCDGINYFIGVLNSAVKQKYSIVNLRRKEVKRKDLIQYNLWKIQGEEYKMTGQTFFTPEDLLNLTNYKLDKTSEKMIQILRHTQRLRQTHVNKNVVLYTLLKT